MNCFLYTCTQFFVEHFASISSEMLAYSIFVLLCLYLALAIGVILASLKEFENAFSVSIVLNNLRSIGCRYSLKV